MPLHAACAAIFRALCRSRPPRRRGPGLAPTACRAARAAERVIAQRWRRVSAFRARPRPRGYTVPRNS
eukprot:3733352-Rhodomonas_salina.1